MVTQREATKRSRQFRDSFRQLRTEWGSLTRRGARAIEHLGFCYFTSLVVLVSTAFAVDFVALCRQHPGSQTRVDVASGLAAWDGQWYVRIASAGYSYDPERMSSVAFFPLYPWLAGAIVHTTGMRPEWALLLVSHGALLATFALMAAYVRQRFPSIEQGLVPWTLLALGLFPTTFYFRMTYTESIFVLVTLLALYGMQRGWRPLSVALVIGLATAVRTVGVALVPAFALYLWERMVSTTNGEADEIEVESSVVSANGGSISGVRRCWRALTLALSRSRRERELGSHFAHGVSGLLFSWSLRMAAWLPVCCWGLLGYMAFQWIAFGEPMAFVKTQVHWGHPRVGLTQNALALLSLEPIRATYDPSSSFYWGRVPPEGNLLFNLKAANPVFFLSAVALIGIGTWKRWLNGRELLLSAGLLLIPYCLQGARAGMSSQARYAAVVFPMYLVLGQLLYRAPAPLAAALLAVSGLFLAIYSAMFVSWYFFY